MGLAHNSMVFASHEKMGSKDKSIWRRIRQGSIRYLTEDKKPLISVQPI